MFERRRSKHRGPCSTSCLHKGLTKENGVSERVRIGTEKATMVAQVAKMEERISGKRATARKADKGRRNVAREKAEPVGRVERQDT